MTAYRAAVSMTPATDLHELLIRVKNRGRSRVEHCEPAGTQHQGINKEATAEIPQQYYNLKPL